MEVWSGRKMREMMITMRNNITNIIQQNKNKNNMVTVIGWIAIYVAMFCFGWWVGEMMSNTKYRNTVSKIIKLTGVTALWLVIYVGGMSSNMPIWLTGMVGLAYVANMVNVLISK